MEPEEFLTVADIARRLHFSEGTIRQIIRQKKMRAHRYGKEYRVHVTDFDRYLLETETRPREMPGQEESKGDLVEV